MSSREVAALLFLWVGLPAAALALLASEALPSARLAPAQAFAAVAAAQGAFALWGWPAFVRRVLARTPTIAEAARELGWRMAALGGLGLPLAWAGAGLAGTSAGNVAAAAGLLGLWLAGGALVGLTTRAAGGAGLRGYVALALAASAGLPLGAYLCAELRGQVEAGAALLRASPIAALLDAAAGDAAGWRGAALAYAGVAAAWVLAVRVVHRVAASRGAPA